MAPRPRVGLLSSPSRSCWRPSLEFDVAPHPHLVVITDAPHLLAARTSPLRRVVVADRSTALIVLVDADEGIPHVCTSLLDLSGPDERPVVCRRRACLTSGSGAVRGDQRAKCGQVGELPQRPCRPGGPAGWRRRNPPRRLVAVAAGVSPGAGHRCLLGGGRRGPVAAHGDRCRCRRCGRHRSRSRRAARSDGRNHGRGQERAVAHVGRRAGGWRRVRITSRSC